MAKAIVPVLDDFIARGVLQLIRQRPGAGPFVISQRGRYFDVFAGWRAQLVLLRRRLIDEARARRLPTATGKALAELCASEFFAEIDPEPQTAVGSVLLTRPTADRGEGTIKQGTRFRLSADPDASPPVKEASYVAREPVFVPRTGPDSLTCEVPLIATHSGSEPNVPRFLNGNSPQIALADSVFDPTFSVPTDGGTAAGGSSAVDANDLRRLARALYTGQHSPTDGAILAGALSSSSVKHVALVRDARLARSILFIADSSWAWSQAFQDQCAQSLKDKWLGWGARLEVRPVVNVLIALSATVVLADAKFGDDTTDLRAKVRTQVRKYFDERPDFYTFDLNAIGGLIAAADPRILNCTAVSVAQPSGVPLSPIAPLSSATGAVPHYVLPDNGITLTLSSPK